MCTTGILLRYCWIITGVDVSCGEMKPTAQCRDLRAKPVVELYASSKSHAGRNIPRKCELTPVIVQGSPRGEGPIQRTTMPECTAIATLHGMDLFLFFPPSLAWTTWITRVEKLRNAIMVYHHFARYVRHTKTLSRSLRVMRDRKQKTLRLLDASRETHAKHLHSLGCPAQERGGRSDVRQIGLAL